jgi:colanic acid/amylovoran biosynthesis glycosyltransferase
MPPSDPARIGYVVKRYPRYSETFIVNEILAHEAAGLEIEVFSLLPSNDTHFQDVISRVRAPVTHLGAVSVRSSDLWMALERADEAGLDLGAVVRSARGEDVKHVVPALWLAVEVRRRRLAHLHAHFATSAAAVARLASRFAGIPFTLTAHAKDIFHESVDAGDLARVFDDAEAVVTVSEHNVAYLSETVAGAADKVVRIYNGLDLTRFTYTPPEDGPPVIVGVGRLVEKKGFEDLVSACALLADRGRAFRCDIIGSGPLEGELLEQIAASGLLGQVSLVGPRPQHEVIARVRAASVFAAPCVVGDDGNRDGLPTVLLEAMALGTACVATPVTGIPEAIVHDESGLLVPERHPASLADAIERLLDDRALRTRLAAGARRRIEHDFDIASNTAELRSLFAQKAPAADSRVELV